MNFVKINMSGASGTYTYNGYYVPRVGESVNFSFASIAGVVSAVEWTHTQEVTVTVKPN